MAGFIERSFVPFRAHIKEQPQTFERFGAQWTPTVVLAEPDGTERYRFEGFLPKSDYLAQLKLGLAHAARARNEFAEAETLYRDLAKGDDEVAAEALYWAGVSRYKAFDDAAALGETAKTFQSRFPDSPWAKKASVWGG